MKILIVSDAWMPQINGVVRALEAISKELTRMGHDVRVIGPDVSRPYVVSAPFYPKIEMEFFSRSRLEKALRDFSPDAVHIATEGPLGRTARRLCLRRGRPFTTSFHTRFPDYIAKYAPKPLTPFFSRATYAILRRFHAPSNAVMVATPSVANDLRAHGFRRVVRYSQGVDAELFKLYGKSHDVYGKLPRPILLNVGRVSAEKNLRAFLDLKTPGSKVVIGEGPDLEALRREYPQAHFTGLMSGENLARAYAAADVFVFPSKTDTFGLVLLEACASGLRIAAYPVSGPADIFSGEETRAFAALDEDLQVAVDRALSLPDNPEVPRAFASGFSWASCARQFFNHLVSSVLISISDHQEAMSGVIPSPAMRERAPVTRACE